VFFAGLAGSVLLPLPLREPGATGGQLGLLPLLRALRRARPSRSTSSSNLTVVVELVPAGQALGIMGISGLSSTAVGPAPGEVVRAAFGARGLLLGAALLPRAETAALGLAP
jgi:hypothetical protein